VSKIPFGQELRFLPSDVPILRDNRAESRFKASDYGCTQTNYRKALGREPLKPAGRKSFAVDKAE
jgi:hypothetical protein